MSLKIKQFYKNPWLRSGNDILNKVEFTRYTIYNACSQKTEALYLKKLRISGLRKFFTVLTKKSVYYSFEDE